MIWKLLKAQDQASGVFANFQFTLVPYLKFLQVHVDNVYDKHFFQHLAIQYEEREKENVEYLYQFSCIIRRVLWLMRLLIN